MDDRLRCLSHAASLDDLVMALHGNALLILCEKLSTLYHR